MKALERIYVTRHGKIHYWVTCAREGRPWLVFLPGLTADHHLFDAQIAHFRDNFNCLVWDAPAHGASRPFALAFSMGDLAHWLREIFAIEGVERPVLIGQSLGGYIAQYYMDEYPGSVSGFISIDSCPLKRSYYTWWELAMLKRTKWMYMSIPWKLLVRWGSWGTARSEYGRALMKQTMESFEKREYCALADHGYRMLAKAVEAKRNYDMDCLVLLLCGEKDMAGSAKRYNKNWKEKEGYELIWIPGAGHNSNTDAPEIINPIIEAFIESL